MGIVFKMYSGESRDRYPQIHGDQPWGNSLPASCETYFRLHEDDDHEPALLAAGLNALPAEDMARAEAACAQMSVALWDALSGLHAPHAAACMTN